MSGFRVGRFVMALVGGLLAFVIVTWIGQIALMAAYPLPEGTDINDPKALAAAIEAMPADAFGMLWGNYLVAALAGGAVAGLAGRSAGRTGIIAAVVVGLFATGGAILNLMTLSHPTWFVAINLPEFLVGTIVGARLVKAWGPRAPSSAG